MSDGLDDRRAELIAAAIADQLSPEELAELDALRGVDPSIDAEIASLRGAAEKLSAVDEWIEAVPTLALRDRISAMAATHAAAERTDAVTPIDAATPTDPTEVVARPVVALAGRERRRPALLLLGAAACIALGVLGGSLLPRGETAPVAGPAGTLGALEPVSFTGEPAGVEIDGDLVAHTWGTETVLMVDGLEVGADYTVVVTDRAGRQHVSGSFIGAEATVDCAMNAAVLREDVVTVTIVGMDGVQVAVADVPPVAA